jgi:outer membrane protein OmpA-like peptidoglycan-associated protein
MTESVVNPFKHLYAMVCLTAAFLLVGCTSPSGVPGGSGEEMQALVRRISEVERKLDIQTTQVSRFSSDFGRWQDSMAQLTGGLPTVGGIKSSNMCDELYMHEIFFQVNSFAIDQSERIFLDSAARILSFFPGSFIQVEGYTDQTGSLLWNNHLSFQRAQAAIQYLVEKFEIPVSRLSSVAMGPRNQKYGSDVSSVKGNKNRRIAIKVLRYKESK